MSSVSSLLRSAASARKKIKAQEDALVAYEWENSAQTYADFREYSSYLEKASKGSDPSDRLTYANKLRSARRSYTSNELQRQQMAIMENTGTTQDKMGAVQSLYNQAVANGDFNLAQNLASQWDSLSIKLQNEAESAQRAAGTMALNGIKDLSKLVKQFKEGTEGVELPDGRLIKPIAMLNSEIGGAGETSVGYFKEVSNTIQALQEVLYDAYQGAQTQEAVDSIANKFGEIIEGTATFKTAAGSLSAQEIKIAYESALANNPLYSPVASRDPLTGKTSYKLQKNKVDDFIWTRDDNGYYQAVEATTKIPSPNQTLSTQITDEGYLVGSTTDDSDVGSIDVGTRQVNRNSAMSIENRLRSQGYEVEPSEDGKLLLTLPTGEQFSATIQPDGNLRYFGPQGTYSGDQAGLYEVSILNGQVREVAPDEISIFGDASNFGGQISRASEAGRNVIKSFAGITQNNNKLFIPGQTITNAISNDFTGLGTPVIANNLQGTTNILNKAMSTQQQKKEEAIRLQAEKRAMEQLQSATAFNLNQTPVQQFANNGAPIRQLRVAKPIVQRTLKVAAPTPNPRISSVSVAPTDQRITGTSVDTTPYRVRVE